MQSTILREKRSNTDLGIISELIKLMKPRVMSLVIFTCAVGLLTAPNSIPFTQAAIGILIVAIGAGAAGALNMWYEADLDKLMTRTCLRPIPRGKLNRAQALYFGATLSIISVFSLYYFTNAISAFLLFFTIFFYLFIYTIWLKRRTPQNIVIGGAAGALPPVIGWTIATNSLSIEPLVFFLIIFVLGLTLTIYYNYLCFKLYNYKKNKFEIKIAKQIFAYSIFYLFLIFVLFLIDKLI